jgi:2-polyprenyl-3-methyl-5-hydroxy-6-metoxy-1,4-benzoquinol methylase
MLDLSRIGRNLRQLETGLWASETHGSVSYPEQGNELCSALEHRSFWFRHRNRCILAALSAFPPDGPTFDVGGGNGFVAAAMRDAGFEVVVVEAGNVGAVNALRRGLTPVVWSTFQEAGFRPGSLPAVGCFDVLEHIESDISFLRELRTAMVPGGYLYLTVPAYGWLWSTDDDHAQHFHRYTRGGLQRALSSAGFSVSFATYFFSWLPLPILFARALPSRLGWKRGITNRTEALEHLAGQARLSGVAERSLSFEPARIRLRRSIALGGSCLAVARVPSD